MTDKYAPQKRYKAKKIKKLNVDLNVDTDKDIIEYLDSVPNKAKLIKQLIREDIKKANGD